MAVLLAITSVEPTVAQEQATGTDFAVSREAVPGRQPAYSPFVGQAHPDRVFWDEAHLHTSYSWDAGLVGSTVVVGNATYMNDIGDALFMTYWEDPDFNAAERAFYYVRVLEIPRPRWTTHDAVFFGLDLPNGVPATQQDGAYTSPIWYTP